MKTHGPLNQLVSNVPLCPSSCFLPLKYLNYSVEFCSRELCSYSWQGSFVSLFGFFLRGSSCNLQPWRFITTLLLQLHLAHLCKCLPTQAEPETFLTCRWVPMTIVLWWKVQWLTGGGLFLTNPFKRKVRHKAAHVWKRNFQISLTKEEKLKPAAQTSIIWCATTDMFCIAYLHLLEDSALTQMLSLRPF